MIEYKRFCEIRELLGLEYIEQSAFNFRKQKWSDEEKIIITPLRKVNKIKQYLKLDNSHYHRIHQEYNRSKISSTYFNLWNRGLIESRNIDEKQLFTEQDYYYIKKNNGK